MDKLVLENQVKRLKMELEHLKSVDGGSYLIVSEMLKQSLLQTKQELLDCRQSLKIKSQLLDDRNRSMVVLEQQERTNGVKLKELDIQRQILADSLLKLQKPSKDMNQDWRSQVERLHESAKILSSNHFFATKQLQQEKQASQRERLRTLELEEQVLRMKEQETTLKERMEQYMQSVQDQSQSLFEDNLELKRLFNTKSHHLESMNALLHQQLQQMELLLGKTLKSIQSMDPTGQSWLKALESDIQQVLQSSQDASVETPSVNTQGSKTHTVNIQAVERRETPLLEKLELQEIKISHLRQELVEQRLLNVELRSHFAKKPKLSLETRVVQEEDRLFDSIVKNRSDSIVSLVQTSLSPLGDETQEQEDPIYISSLMGTALPNQGDTTVFYYPQVYSNALQNMHSRESQTSLLREARASQTTPSLQSTEMQTSPLMQVTTESQTSNLGLVTTEMQTATDETQNVQKTVLEQSEALCQTDNLGISKFTQAVQEQSTVSSQTLFKSIQKASQTERSVSFENLESAIEKRPQGTIDRLRTVIENLERELSTKNEMLDALQSEQRAIDEIKILVNSKDKQLDILKSETQSKTKQIEILKSELHLKIQKLSEQEQLLGQREKHMQNLVQELSEKDKQIDELYQVPTNDAYSFSPSQHLTLSLKESESQTETNPLKETHIQTVDKTLVETQSQTVDKTLNEMQSQTEILPNKDLQDTEIQTTNLVATDSQTQTTQQLKETQSQTTQLTAQTGMNDRLSVETQTDEVLVIDRKPRILQKLEVKSPSILDTIFSLAEPSGDDGRLELAAKEYTKLYDEYLRFRQESEQFQQKFMREWESAHLAERRAEMHRLQYEKRRMIEFMEQQQQAAVQRLLEQRQELMDELGNCQAALQTYKDKWQATNDLIQDLEREHESQLQQALETIETLRSRPKPEKSEINTILEGWNDDVIAIISNKSDQILSLEKELESLRQAVDLASQLTQTDHQTVVHSEAQTQITTMLERDTQTQTREIVDRFCQTQTRETPSTSPKDTQTLPNERSHKDTQTLSSERTQRQVQTERLMSTQPTQTESLTSDKQHQTERQTDELPTNDNQSSRLVKDQFNAFKNTLKHLLKAKSLDEAELLAQLEQRLFKIQPKKSQSTQIVIESRDVSVQSLPLETRERFINTDGTLALTAATQTDQMLLPHNSGAQQTVLDSASQTQQMLLDTASQAQQTELHTATPNKQEKREQIQNLDALLLFIKTDMERLSQIVSSDTSLKELLQSILLILHGLTLVCDSKSVKIQLPTIKTPFSILMNKSEKWMQESKTLLILNKNLKRELAAFTQPVLQVQSRTVSTQTAIIPKPKPIRETERETGAIPRRETNQQMHSLGTQTSTTVVDTGTNTASLQYLRDRFIKKALRRSAKHQSTATMTDLISTREIDLQTQYQLQNSLTQTETATASILVQTVLKSTSASTQTQPFTPLRQVLEPVKQPDPTPIKLHRQTATQTNPMMQDPRIHIWQQKYTQLQEELSSKNNKISTLYKTVQDLSFRIPQLEAQMLSKNKQSQDKAIQVLATTKTAIIQTQTTQQMLEIPTQTTQQTRDNQSQTTQLTNEALTQTVLEVVSKGTDPLWELPLDQESLYDSLLNSESESELFVDSIGGMLGNELEEMQQLTAQSFGQTRKLAEDFFDSDESFL